MDLEELLAALASDDDLRAKFTAASSSDERAQVLREAGCPIPDAVQLETIHAQLSGAAAAGTGSTFFRSVPASQMSASASAIPDPNWAGPRRAWPNGGGP